MGGKERKRYQRKGKRKRLKRKKRRGKSSARARAGPGNFSSPLAEEEGLDIKFLKVVLQRRKTMLMYS